MRQTPTRPRLRLIPRDRATAGSAAALQPEVRGLRSITQPPNATSQRPSCRVNHALMRRARPGAGERRSCGIDSPAIPDPTSSRRGRLHRAALPRRVRGLDSRRRFARHPLIRSLGKAGVWFGNSLVTATEECPACRAGTPVPILYGLYRRDSREALQAKYPDGYLFGGCVISGAMPNRACRACGTHYRFLRQSA